MALLSTCPCNVCECLRVHPVRKADSRSDLGQPDHGCARHAEKTFDPRHELSHGGAAHAKQNCFPRRALPLVLLLLRLVQPERRLQLLELRLELMSSFPGPARGARPGPGPIRAGVVRPVGGSFSGRGRVSVASSIILRFFAFARGRLARRVVVPRIDDTVDATREGKIIRRVVAIARTTRDSRGPARR